MILFKSKSKSKSKSNFIFNKVTKNTLTLLIGGLAFNSQLLLAHEMWIEPLRFSVAPKGKIFAHEKVGQNFKGNTYAYLDSRFKQLDISQAHKTKPIKSRLGDKPFIQEVIDDEGLVILSAVSNGSELVYKTKEQFETFINDEKLDWLLKEHQKRGLPEKGFKEIFRRYAKSLVKVGHGKGEDTALGLPLEWVVKTNPYISKPDVKDVTACLVSQGEGVANKSVHVFSKIFDEPKVKSSSTSSDKLLKDNKSLNIQNLNLSKAKKITVIKSDLVTDANGCINIPRTKGIYLINAVKVIRPSSEVFNNTGAVWESLWASITFAIE